MRAEAEILLDRLYAAFPLKTKPTIVWKRLRVTAGQAHFEANRIALSEIVVNCEERMIDTLVHEYAHLLAFHRHGRAATNHGPYWRKAMQDLGAKPTVRHRYEVQRNVISRDLLYVCERCGTQILKARRLDPKRRYHHVRCGGRIKFAGMRATDDPSIA